MPAILNSWKEICVFLNCGVRTAQRWERDCGLPVRRVRTGGRGPVFAFATEIQAWLHGRKSKIPLESSSPSSDGIVHTPLNTDALAHQRDLRATMRALLRVQSQKMTALAHSLDDMNRSQ
jgi:hypothetical protein